MKKFLVFLTFCFTVLLSNVYAQSCYSSFTFSISSGNSLKVNFKDSSGASRNSNITSWDWGFGDGFISDSINPSHTYDSAGRYQVCLKITDGTLCTNTFCDSVTVTNPICNAKFSYTVDSLNEVTFKNESKHIDAFSYQWNFRETLASVDTSVNPFYEYRFPGVYYVTLTAIRGLDTCEYSDSVYVNFCEASFTYTVDSSSVSFQSTSRTSEHTRYEWSFYSGSLSFDENPAVNFDQIGEYSATLNTYDSVSGCTSTVTDSILITKLYNCQSKFIYTVSGLTVSFFDSSFSGNPTGLRYFKYEFGDNQSAVYSNNDTVPATFDTTHTYSRAGKYLVSFFVTDSLGCESVSYDSIEVVEPSRCSAGFSYVLKNDTVEFTSSAMDFTTITYYFGDGDSSLQPNPTHIYLDSGAYQVCQTVENSITNCISTFCDTIIVTVPPAFRASFTYSNAGDSVLFKNESTNFTRLVYYFGDGDSSTLENPDHIYEKSNIYTVLLVAFNDNRNEVDSFSIDIPVTVSSSCQAKYSVAIDTTKKKQLYLINFSSNYPTHKYLWDFGDGNTGEGRVSSNTYSNFGKYSICLTVSDSVQDCISTYCDSVGLDSNSNVLKSNGFRLNIFDGNPIGLEENTLDKEISLYPNPFNNEISIEVTERVQDLKISLADLNGKIILEKNITGSKNQLNLYSIDRGMYLLILSNKDGRVVKRIIKQ